METKKSRFLTIKETFQGIHSFVEGFSDDDILNGDEDRFRSHLDRLNQTAAMEVDDDLVQHLLNDAELKQIISVIARVKRLHSIRMEIRRAKAVISSIDPWQTMAEFVYYPNYLKLAQMEYTGAELSPKDQVAFIGSGPLPLSLILMCKRYDIRAVGLEQDPQSVSLSRELIDALGLSRRILIISGNHRCLPLETKCQLIMVGAEALPKNEIFDHLAEVLPVKTKLSYRIFEKGLRRLLDDQSDFTPPPVFREFARVRPEPPVNNTAVFLIKE